MASGSQPSRPCLPQSVLEAYKKHYPSAKQTSLVFGPHVGALRQDMSNRRMPPYPFPREIYEVDFFNGFRAPTGLAPGSTILHYAVVIVDVLLLYEMVRMGVPVHARDSQGRTAFTLLCASLVSGLDSRRPSILPQWTAHPWRPQPAGFTPRDKDAEFECASMLHMAEVLLNQHVEVNLAVEGLTPLQNACKSKIWFLIRLLLEHGADVAPPGPPPQSFFTTRGERAQYARLVSEHLNRPRPPHRCPCWSGLPLDHCHGREAKPYPPTFICPCGKGKTFGKCCARRHLDYQEEWDTERRSLVVVKNFGLELRDDKPGGLSSLLGMEAAHQMPSSVVDDPFASLGPYLDVLQKMGLLDPAFVACFKSSHLLPYVYGRSIPQVIAVKQMSEWNAEVDKYIASGMDPRPPSEIEYMCKVGMFGGPLFLNCEGPDCGKLERRDVEKVKKCSVCKLAVYCSAACQKKAWKSHKAVCNTEKQQCQTLPSQAVLDAWTRKANMTLDEIEEISRVDARDVNRSRPMFVCV